MQSLRNKLVNHHPNMRYTTISMFGSKLFPQKTSADKGNKKHIWIEQVFRYKTFLSRIISTIGNAFLPAVLYSLYVTFVKNLHRWRRPTFFSRQRLTERFGPCCPSSISLFRMDKLTESFFVSWGDSCVTCHSRRCRHSWNVSTPPNSVYIHCLLFVNIHQKSMNVNGYN